MSAEGDALKAAAVALAEVMVNPPPSPEAPITEAANASYQEQFKKPERDLRDTIAAYVDAVEATLADHEARIAALEP